jgi:hypothetical protein
MHLSLYPIIIIIIITITGNSGTHDPKPRRTLASRPYRPSTRVSLDHGGGRWTGLFAIRKLIKSSFNMIDTICNRTYIYSILLEDPAVDQQILKITKDDVIFRICSAGDIVLDYAIEGPAKIVVCDAEPSVGCFELKIGMLRDPDLTYDEWWAIGDLPVAVAMKVWKRMRHTLSVPDASGGMDVSNASFARIRHVGSTGFAAKFLIPWLMYVVGFDIRPGPKRVSHRVH